MKTSRDPRHIERQNIVKALFAHSFVQQEQIAQPKAQKIIENCSTIDAFITKIAPEFPIEKLNRVDLAILRLGVYELAIEREQPPKVVIDESIELAKEFGGESSPGFINGALGTLLKTYISEK